MYMHAYVQTDRTDLERGAEGGDELRGELLDEAHRIGQQNLGEGALELRERQLAVVIFRWVVGLMRVSHRVSQQRRLVVERRDDARHQ
jgi:hypothetical protein